MARDNKYYCFALFLILEEEETLIVIDGEIYVRIRYRDIYSLVHLLHKN